jgi:mono/diheme cytochrome c family protein/uncharacterized membrane protein
MNFSELIGRLHPVLVHLPIGILLLAALFYFLSKKEKFAVLQPAIRIALFWGVLSAAASCISGLLLSRSGDYDEQLVNTHKWFGIAVALVSLFAYLFHSWENGFEKWLVPVLVLLIIVTGHLGGSLTHGPDYLSAAFKTDSSATAEPQPVPDVQEAVVYSDIIQPIFQSRCYTCHSASKKKGGLRLDKPELILKGGKDGLVIKPGNADESDMIKRLLLPRNHEDHMPPNEKPQLKEGQIALIHWWISTGASFDRKTKELEQPEKLKPVLLVLQQPLPKKGPPDVPEEPVTAADEKVLQKLKARGIVVLPVARNSNYLSVNYVSVDSLTVNDISLLLPLKKQVVWLRLSYKNIADSLLNTVGQLSNLTRLQLDNTPVTDKGLSHLSSLKKLQHLNLVNTAVTGNGIMQLKNLPDLQAVYLYKTKTGSNDWMNLRNAFPNVTLDTGGYVVPFLETDTMIVKPPKKN